MNCQSIAYSVMALGFAIKIIGIDTVIYLIRKVILKRAAYREKNED